MGVQEYRFLFERGGAFLSNDHPQSANESMLFM